MLSARIAYRNLPRRKARSILTVTAVVLGVALLVGINMATVSAQTEFSGYINKFWGQTDIVVRYSAPVRFGNFPFKTGNTSIVGNVTGIRQTAERLDWIGSIDNPTYSRLEGIAATDFDFSSLNITGSHNLSTGQAVIGSTLAEKYGLTIGSSLKLFTPAIVSWSPPEARNVTLTVSVAGVDHPLRNLGSTVYVNLPQLQSVTGLQKQITRVLATVTDPTQAPTVRDKVQSQLPLFEVTAPKAEAAQRIQGQMAGFQLGLNVMVGVALVVCAFIVFNTFFMSVSERTYEIGVMRAVGTSRRQVFDVFLGEGLILGLLGGTIGLLVGLGLSRIFPFHIPYLDTILIPIGLVVLGALVFGRTGQFLSIPVRPLTRGLVYLVSRGNRRRLVRNTVCFGMIAVTLSFVIMLGGIQSGVQVAVEQGIREALGADIFLVANQSIPITLTNQLESISQVSTATPLGFSTVSSKAVGPTSKASNIGILAVDPSVFPSVIAYNFVNSPPPDQAYQALAASNQSLLMPDSLANKTGVVVGDTLSVTVSTGGFVQFKVAGIFNGPVLQYLQFGDSFASDSIIVSFKSQQQYFAGEMSAPIFLVNLKPEYKAQASSVAHNIATTFPNYDLAENSVTLSELLSLVRTTIDRIFVLILLVLYFALLIATLGIGATMIMNVADRRREIGLLRSQGVSRGQMLGMFLGEGLVLGIFGFLLAIPGGLLLLKGATNSTTIAGFWLPFIVPWTAIAQALPLAMAAVLVGSLYPAYRASRMEITEALEQV